MSGSSSTEKKSSQTEKNKGLYITLISLHGLIRANNLELGRDSDTGGQVTYVLELAKALGDHPQVAEVELLTRQIIDEKVSEDYAQLEERISENAKIVRIPFGPKRYLKKEKLWPYLDSFVDQTLIHFRRSGRLPDIIHGHYADAGYAGAQLARLLHVTFAFTGHSLGRIKKQRFLKGGQDAKKLEESFHFTQRIEAEEQALETASLIVTSTQQEVAEQYELYDQYVPERMEVIPPGVDLSRFRMPAKDEPRPEIADAFARFLNDPDKPMILAMARPDERKNLEMLVQVYGKSKELQKLANLCLVMGCRDDMREMSSGQRKVLHNILTLIDVYDLYGKVAYPKFHRTEDVPAMYRLAASTGGIFINPALTEPFGLTLLEAAGSGLPVVATNDGGPRDIIANCKHGMLIDPFVPEDIEHAIIRSISDHDKWREWSKNGSVGAKKHYTWDKHVERYMRDVSELQKEMDTPNLLTKSKKGQIPLFDRILVTDIDNTLTGDPEGLKIFLEQLEGVRDNVGFAIATGRSFEDVLEVIKEHDIPIPDILIAAVGTEIFYGKKFVRDRSWKKQLDFHWDAKSVRETLKDLPGFYPQDKDHQSPFKVSYEIDKKVAPKLAEIRRLLREKGLRVKPVLSHNMFLDIIPTRAGSGMSIRHLLYKWGFATDRVLVAGDSGNDEEMLSGNTLGVVVGNHTKDLDKLRGRPRIYFAEAHHARGILEGIEYYDFFGQLKIPNDRVE